MASVYSLRSSRKVSQQCLNVGISILIASWPVIGMRECIFVYVHIGHELIHTPRTTRQKCLRGPYRVSARVSTNMALRGTIQPVRKNVVWRRTLLLLPNNRVSVPSRKPVATSFHTARFRRSEKPRFGGESCCSCRTRWYQCRLGNPRQRASKRTKPSCCLRTRPPLESPGPSRP